MVWGVDPSHCYYIKSAYNVLTEDSNVRVQLPGKNLWHKCIPLKVAVFAWQVFQNRILSKDNLYKRGIISTDALQCVVGCGEQENLKHLFFNVLISLKCEQGLQIACLWSIWKEINKRIFQNKEMKMDLLIDQVRVLSWNWLRVKSKGMKYDLAQWWTNPLACLGVVGIV